jgi:hypothetical protein
VLRLERNVRLLANSSVMNPTDCAQAKEFAAWCRMCDGKANDPIVKIPPATYGDLSHLNGIDMAHSY